MARWRERAFREVRDQLDRFLNFPINNSIELGDYGAYNGGACRFERVGNVADLGVTKPAGTFQHEIAETYVTAGRVQIQGQLELSNGPPSVDVNFSRASTFAFRAFKIGLAEVHTIALADELSAAIRGGQKWDKKHVIVTQLWRAGGFTHLVAGAKNANIRIEARAPGAPAMFDFADPSMKLKAVSLRSMGYSAIAETDLNPYFSVHKLRSTGPYGLYKYGLPR